MSKAPHTKHLPDKGEFSATLAGGVKPEALTEEEKGLIKGGILGYCETHKILYYKWALHSCVIPAIFDERRKPCKEWPTDPPWKPGPCKPCAGTGEIGLADGEIVCPTCYGSGDPDKPGPFKKLRERDRPISEM